jgi:hypothetical protein
MYKSGSGFLIPMDADTGERHRCINSSFERERQGVGEARQGDPSKQDITGFFNSERIVLDVQAAILRANEKLDTFYLRLERVPKSQGQSTLA